MMLVGRRVVLAAMLLASTACQAGPPVKPLPLRLVADVPLGQPTSRYDYESIDPKTGLLFIADLAESRVLVFDTHTNKLIKTISNIMHVHGVITVRAQGRAYATATGTDELVTIDESTLEIIQRVPAGHYPDGLAWTPQLNKIYVSDEHGKTIAAIAVAKNQLLKLIPIGGEVGNTQFNSADGLIYSNDQTNNELVAIDPAKDIVVGRWKLSGCVGTHGLQLDPSRQLAYAACEDNAKLATFSIAEHKLVDLQSVGAGPDVMAADFAMKRLYVAGESGIVSVFDITGSVPSKIGEAKLADNAHVVAVDDVTHRVYFPLRNANSISVLRVMEPKL